jgi:transcriptional regulator with XRE-family HTH domain
MNLGKAIRQLRKARQLSQETFAYTANITQATLSRIESGERPGEETLNKLCKALKVPVMAVYLIAAEETDFPEKSHYEAYHPLLIAIALGMCKYNNIDQSLFKFPPDNWKDLTLKKKKRVHLTEK